MSFAVQVPSECSTALAHIGVDALVQAYDFYKLVWGDTLVASSVILQR